MAQINNNQLKTVMILTTTNQIEGKVIDSYLGINRETIIGANIFKDIFASIRDVVGGRSGSYERVLREARESALNEMSEIARSKGASYWY